MNDTQRACKLMQEIYPKIFPCGCDKVDTTSAIPSICYAYQLRRLAMAQMLAATPDDESTTTRHTPHTHRRSE